VKWLSCLLSSEFTLARDDSIATSKQWLWDFLYQLQALLHKKGLPCVLQQKLCGVLEFILQ